MELDLDGGLDVVEEFLDGGLEFDGVVTLDLDTDIYELFLEWEFIDSGVAFPWFLITTRPSSVSMKSSTEKPPKEPLA